MKRIFAIVMSILILSLVSCSRKKSVEDMLKDESKITENADINKKLSELKTKLSSAKDDFERSEIHGQISEIELEKGDIISSRKSANEAVKFYPQSAFAHYTLGKSLLLEGRLSEAETELNSAVSIDQKHAPSWYELGNLNYIRKNYMNAVTMYQRAVALNQNFYEAYNNLGSAYYTLKRGKESEQAFLKVQSIKSDFAPLYKNMGLLYERVLNDKVKAAASYKEYLRRRPNAPERAAVKYWIKALES